MTEFRNMSQYIRREFQRWGKEHLVELATVAGVKESNN